MPTRASGWASLLRARGGISRLAYISIGLPDSSPRTRRYFHAAPVTNSSHWLFSAHAEVFHIFRRNHGDGNALLRARGGISGPVGELGGLAGSSPRTRRYFHSDHHVRPGG